MWSLFLYVIVFVSPTLAKKKLPHHELSNYPCIFEGERGLPEIFSGEGMSRRGAVGRVFCSRDVERLGRFFRARDVVGAGSSGPKYLSISILYTPLGILKTNGG